MQKFREKNDGLPQNVKIDLRTTRRHRTFRENFVFRENISHFVFSQNSFSRSATEFFCIFRKTLCWLETLFAIHFSIYLTPITALLYVQYINVYSCNFSALYSLHPFHNCSPAHIKINVYSSKISLGTIFLTSITALLYNLPTSTLAISLLCIPYIHSNSITALLHISKPTSTLAISLGTIFLTSITALLYNLSTSTLAISQLYNPYMTALEHLSSKSTSTQQFLCFIPALNP